MLPVNRDRLVRQVEDGDNLFQCRASSENTETEKKVGIVK